MGEDISDQIPLIGALLVAQGRVELEQILAALELAPLRYPQASLGEVLVREGLISDEILQQASAELHLFREHLGAALTAQVPADVAVFTPDELPEPTPHFDQRRRSEYEMLTIGAWLSTISRATSVNVAMTQMMIIIRDLIAVEGASISLIDEQQNDLVFAFVLGPGSATLQQQRLPLDHGLAGWVARHGEPLLINDVTKDSRFYGDLDNRTGFSTRSLIAVPLMVLGRTLGVLQLVNKLDGEFTEHDLSLSLIAASIGGLLQQINPSPPRPV